MINRLLPSNLDFPACYIISFMLKACDFPKFETHHYFAKARFFYFIIYVDFQLQKQAIIFLVIPISCVL